MRRRVCNFDTCCRIAAKIKAKTDAMTIRKTYRMKILPGGSSEVKLCLTIYARPVTTVKMRPTRISQRNRITVMITKKMNWKWYAWHVSSSCTRFTKICISISSGKNSFATERHFKQRMSRTMHVTTTPTQIYAYTSRASSLNFSLSSPSKLDRYVVSVKSCAIRMTLRNTCSQKALV